MAKLQESDDSFLLIDVYDRRVTERIVLRHMNNFFLFVLKNLLLVVIFREGKAVNVVGNQWSRSRFSIVLFKFCYL